MITSTKNYTKKLTNKQKRNGQTRSLGQMVKAKLYRLNHTKKHTHTHSPKKKKEKKNVSFGKSEVFCQCSEGVL